MSVETRTIPNWSAIEGTVLPGGYEVERCLSADHLAALFRLRILGDRFTEAVVRMFAPGAVSEEEGQTWQDAGSLRHPNLNVVISAGYTTLDTAQLAYVASVRPDETLEGVLGERALSPEEARDVLSNVLDALSYLHGIGWVHSALAPAEVLAVGNAIQLSGVRPRRIAAAYATVLPAVRYLAPESKAANTTPAADMFCLGASLFEILTRRRFEEGVRGQLTVLPHPFDGISEGCLRSDPATRPALDEVRVMLTRPAPVRAPLPPAVDPPVVSMPSAAAAPATAKPPSPPLAEAMPTLPKPGPAPNVAGDATPVLAVYPQRRRRQADDDTAETATADRVWLGMPVRNWLYLTAAVVALLAILWAFHPKPSQSAAVTQTTPSTNPANWPARVAEPATPPPATHRSVPIKQNAATPVSVGASASAANNWRVVAYTFNREADAEKRLNTIKSQHPGLDPHIFSPKGNGAPYLVVLGGRMSKDEAGKLRSKARASGLPRDTYIQNYAR